MGRETDIEWCDATWNPIRGCSRISPGCKNCYAENTAQRFSQEGSPFHGLVDDKGRWNGTIKLVPEHILDPFKWRSDTRRLKIFISSISDIFHENLSFEVIAGLFGIMMMCEGHTFLPLTKRTKRMEWFFKEIDSKAGVIEGYNQGRDVVIALEAQMRRQLLLNSAIDLIEQNTPPEKSKLWNRGAKAWVRLIQKPWPVQNIWLGVSVEDQKRAEQRIPTLLQTPAQIRWISAEPLLGPLDLTAINNGSLNEDESVIVDALRGSVHYGKYGHNIPKLDWVVAGGESGLRARMMDPEWIRMLSFSCRLKRVKFFFKQWGSWAPDSQLPTEKRGPKAVSPSGVMMRKLDKKSTGCTLDGEIIRETPEVI